MKVTFLGTGAAEGIPALWCVCVRCEAARREGGRSLRKRSGLVVDGRLLVDCGPDLVVTSMLHGLDLSQIRTLLITHNHEDHLDLLNIAIRREGFCATPLLEMAVYSGEDVLARLRAMRHDESALRIRATAVAAGDTFAADRYRITALRATHGTPEMRPLFFAIAPADADGPQVLYAHDTGPFPEDTWSLLRNPPTGRRFAFDLVSLDATFGPVDLVGTTHMSVRQAIEHRDRLADAGLLRPGARVFVNHFSHNGTPPHSEMVKLLEGSGVEPSFDGLTVDL